MNAQEIFDLAREYGAEHPGITFDLAALLRYTRKIQEMERERACRIVTGLCISDNNAHEINTKIREGNPWG
jgi:hypothetical protein